MFRDLRRKNQEIAIDECKTILAKSKRAVLSVNGDDGYPYAIPINYTYDIKENAIYLHGAKEGHKIDALKKSDKVSFTTWQEKEKIEFGYKVDSVVVFGRAELVNDIESIKKKLWDIGNKYHQNDEFNKNEIEKNIDKVQIIKINIECITGKHVKEF